MEKFTAFSGLAAPLRRDNVDTDAILPKQFMKSIARTGFGPNLFDSWRYLDIGQPGQDHTLRPLNQDFVLNQPRYQGASVLLAGRNFGCGSSREHAPWALLEYGFRAIIATSFAEIFMQNCYQNGILTIALEEAHMARLFDIAEANEAGAGARLDIDLEQQSVRSPDGVTVSFAIAPFTKHCLLNGLDQIGLTLQQRDRILAFEQHRRARYAWLDTADHVLQ
jgi:3-isopropylmalate/(R)-2-methylmalate dehydratase small subunit